MSAKVWRCPQSKPQRQRFKSSGRVYRNTSDGTRSDIPFPIEREIWDEIQSDSEQTLEPMPPSISALLEHRRTAARKSGDHQPSPIARRFIIKSGYRWERIPTFEQLVLDEGHHLEDSATSLLQALSVFSDIQTDRSLLNTKRRPGALEAISHYYLGSNSLLAPIEAKLTQLMRLHVCKRYSRNTPLVQEVQIELYKIESTSASSTKKPKTPMWQDWVNPN